MSDENCGLNNFQIEPLINPHFVIVRSKISHLIGAIRV
jgi:hypothetical protein